MDIANIQAKFPNISIKYNQPLSQYTTVKIGGPAEVFIETTSSAELIDILKEITKTSDKITILGNGSNTLISDNGISGIVIKNSSKSIDYLPNGQVRVDSGVQLPLLINDTINHSLTGLEEFAYIPSTIGGAIVGNIHGVNKNDFNHFLVSLTIFNSSTSAVEEVAANSLSWSYDTSEFKDHPEWFIISAIIQLEPGVPQTSKSTVADIVSKKSAVQSMNSLGCIFKNPANDSAGRIIDQELNLKGFRLGNIQVSEKHANFILNLGQGTASDYLSLIQKIQSEAKAKGFNLETEIKLLGNF